MNSQYDQELGGSASIIVFTLHKSASMLLHNLCGYLSGLGGIQYHSPNQENGGLDARTLLTDKGVWNSRKGCFAPIRFYVDVPDISQYQLILHLRDPRDVLVSMYYSYCFIHGGEMQGGTGYRGNVAEKGIDKFVLEVAREDRPGIIGDYGTGGHVVDVTGGIVKKYRDYINNILGRENTIFLKYEDMVLDFRGWLEQFIKPFPIEDKIVVVNNLVANSQQIFPARTHDVMQHIRHITPGDHKNKLKEKTVMELNYIFRDVLDVLGYDSAL